MPQPHRRGLVLGTIGLVGAGIGGRLVTMDDIDSSARVREEIADGVATLRAAWERTPPAQVIDSCWYWDHVCKTVGTDHRDWVATHAQVMLLDAQARADVGQTEVALASAQSARVLAHDVGDMVTRAHAEVVAAEITDSASVTSSIPLILAQRARGRAGRSRTAIYAATIEANILGRRGQAAAAEVLDVIRQAERLDATLPPAGPGEFSSGHLAAFAGSALVRAGRVDEAGPRLVAAAEAFGSGSGRPRETGAASAVQLYRAQAAMKVGAHDEAMTYAQSAMNISAHRPAAWLARSVLTMAGGRTTAGWAPLRRQAEAWTMA